MRKTFITGLMAAALMGVGLGFASPAQAAGTLTDNGDGTFTVASLGGSEQVAMCASSVSAAACTTAGPGPTGVLYTTGIDGTYGVGDTVAGLNGLVSLPAGTYTIVVRDQNFTPPALVTSLLNFAVGGGGGTSSGATSQPQPVALSINTVDGSSCRQSSESGIAGTWIDLPSADDCTAPASKPGATLLGWATDANFPVEIAQRQIDNGWGAYEMFNDEGRLTAVFIPAGGATFLSGAGNLFAIWSE